ncbi:rod-binding protein [Senegalia massiliensis]|uniref:Flagellar biosynthesis protein FlgJ n=1 Tax=Senegalia massiliensis TaxID=1720316 RepID=A0A845QT64_9CLOT|nr:rod-binding protein [Senegalia massiliensis]NBI06017.1 flagellar biosynthesis protein FlgJ [Senegalia massiliensis]
MQINNINNYTQKIETQKTKDQEILLEACKDFEAIFTGIMFKEMNKTVMESNFTEKSRGREIFTDMFHEELANEASSGENGIGIARMLYNQMKNRI